MIKSFPYEIAQTLIGVTGRDIIKLGNKEPIKGDKYCERYTKLAIKLETTC
jgi:hypothetical protein